MSEKPAQLVLAISGWLAIASSVFAQPTSLLSSSEQAIVVRGADVVGGYRSDRLIIRFAPNVITGVTPGANEKETPTSAAQIVWNVDPPVQLSDAFKAEWRRFNVLRMQRLYSFDFGNPQAAADVGLDRTYLLELPAGSNTPGLVERLRRLGAEVESAELDGIGQVAEFIPNDPEFWRQYDMRNTGGIGAVIDADIDATDAWELFNGIGGAEVVVAVIDSGVNPHAEFRDRMLPGINLSDPNNPTTNTADNCTIAAGGHGTHVTGILTATGNNGVGIAGTTWGAKILPIRVMLTSNPCGGSIAAAAAAVIWAVDNGADVINMSVQYPYVNQPTIPTFENAVNYAHNNGVLLVAAAGNTNFTECGGNVCAPARFNNALAVSGTTAQDRFASFSNHGPEVDVCAPGENIYSTAVISPFVTASGTSMATPHVTGLAALVKSFVPDITVAELRSVITNTAEDLTWNPAGVNGEPALIGFDNYYGHGRINAYRALISAGDFRIIGSNPPDGAIDARQPSELDGANPAGWDSITLLFGGDRGGFAAVSTEEFEVLENGAVAAALSILSVTPDDADSTVIVQFNRPITPGAWTTVRHVASDTAVTIGFLPGDVNGDRLSSPSDILALVDALNGVRPRPDWAIDVDRSGKAGPPDVLRVVDLLNGAAEYSVWLYVALP